MSFDFRYRESDVPLVDMVYATETATEGSFISTAESRWEMVVTKYQGKITLTMRGPEDRSHPSPIPKDGEFIGIVFKHGTFMPHIPASNLLNNEITLPDATSRSFWFYGSAWEFPTFENTDTFLKRLVHQKVLVHDPIVEAVMKNEPVDLTIRSIQRRFLQVTGMSLKGIQQIQRAKQAVALLEQGMPILDTAFEMGFYDQSHLTNALKRYMGRTPAQIVQDMLIP